MNPFEGRPRSYAIAAAALVGGFFVFQNCGVNMPPPMGRAQQPNTPVAFTLDPPNTGCRPTTTVEDGRVVVVNDGNCADGDSGSTDDNDSGTGDNSGDDNGTPGGSEPVAGAPTAPTNLEALLIGNNWSEIQWEEATDEDGTVESYLLYRDGQSLRRISKSYQAGDYREAERYWKTRTYIDCNNTRYKICEEQQPKNGATHVYTLTAFDNEGKESAPSAPLTIQYHPQPYSILDRNRINSEYEIVFTDDFNGSSLNAGKWVMRRPWDDPDGTNRPQSIINQEMQYLVDPQIKPIGYNPLQFFSNGAAQGVALLGARTPANLLAAAQNQPYLSGIFSSRKSFNFKYGFVEARIKPSDMAGTVSTFFLLNSKYSLGQAWQYGEPEIDILEYLGREPKVAFQTYHYRSLTADTEKLTHSSPTQYHMSPAGNFSDAFHTYSVLWEPGLVTWYLDDVQVRRLSGPAVSSEDMYIVFSLVLGSPWATQPAADAAFPARYEVDEVTVRQRK